MTCPRCKCPECRAAAVNAVLARVVSHETDAEAHNERVRQETAAKEAWRDVDPDAEQLASQVGELAGELRRAG